ncbi:MAG TPA: CrcB family protein, partial [Solirubrobacteraceae bacterium]|nr:CrcB family protein [Solirubrobacteraceae bacterium]
MSAWLWLAVACLGACGALARFLVGRAAHAYLHTLTAVGTFIVNISGALAFGVLTGAGLGGNALLLAGAATLGSYTTFSTWMLESE